MTGRGILMNLSLRMISILRFQLPMRKCRRSLRRICLKRSCIIRLQRIQTPGQLLPMQLLQ